MGQRFPRASSQRLKLLEQYPCSFEFVNPLPYVWRSANAITAFDESSNYASTNRVFSVLLGDAVPKELHGSTKNVTCNHYSEMSTVEKNWDLGNLGLADKDAATFF